MGTLQPWIDAAATRRACAIGTINHGLQVVRRILNLAAGEWMDEQGLTWLQAAPKIKLLAESRQAAALSAELGGAGAAVSRAAGPSGGHGAVCRQYGLPGCARSASLRWEWEVEVPELGTSVFIIPGARVKNGEERLVVLNRIARSVVEARRGQHATHVFTYEGQARCSAC